MSAFRLLAPFAAFLLITASVVFCSESRAQGTEDVSALEQQAQAYRDNIAKQQRNISAMSAELQNHPDNPDVKKLGDFFATASGVRTQAYQQEPPYIQALIDKLEADPFLKADNLATLGKYSNNIAHGHFLVEIDRSKKFIAMLRRALKDTESKIANLKSTTAVKIPDSSKFMGTWKYVDGEYEITISGADGEIQGLIKKSTKPDPKFPHDYKVGTTMFENGKMQPDGSCKVDWAQYTWDSPKLNTALGRSSAPATITLKPDGEAILITGNRRQLSDKAGKQKWLNSFGSPFKYSFIKID